MQRYVKLNDDEYAIIKAWRLSDVWTKENVVFSLKKYLKRNIVIKEDKILKFKQQSH